MTDNRIGSGLRAATLSIATMALLATGPVARTAASAGPEPVPPVEPAVEAAGDDELVWDPAMPTWVRAHEQRRLCQLAAAMPSDWPATAVIRRQAEQPLGDAGERDRWRHDGELLPSYWPAAQAMLAAADARSGCSWWIGV